MILPVWVDVLIVLFAGIGVGTVVRGAMTVSRYVVRTASDLSTTLREATEIARAYREDLGVIRQIAQSSVNQNPDDEPESIIPRQTPEAPAAMPPPYWSRFPVKPIEPDAPAESVRDVDVTATAEELIEQEKEQQAVDFETLERQKAATREADQARLKELADLSGQSEEK